MFREEVLGFAVIFAIIVAVAMYMPIVFIIWGVAMVIYLVCVAIYAVVDYFIGRYKGRWR